MTPETPRVGSPGESGRPELAEIAELVGSSDGTLLLAILQTDAHRDEIAAALHCRGDAAGSAALTPKAREVLRLLERQSST